MDFVNTQHVAKLTDSRKSTKRLAAKKKKGRGDKKKDKEEGGSQKKTPLKKLEMKKKLQELSNENESLAKAISEKNLEIAELQRSVQSLNAMLNSVPIDELCCNSSIPGTKILNLNKESRQLSAELETTKNRLRKKDMQLQKLEHELKVAEEKFASDVGPMQKETCKPLAEMQTKIHSLQQKLFESRNKNAELQAQLKLAQKCLQQEIGETFNLNTLASQPEKSQWRGRAQQVLRLQQKIQKLKERLEQCDPEKANDFCGLPTSMSGGGLKSAQKTDSKGSNQVLRGKSPISFQRNEFTHRAKVDALQGEIKALNEQLEDQRHHVLALRVRNKTLNDEVLMLKGKTSTLQQQTNFDGMNLASINEKLNIQKGQYERRIEELRQQLDAAIRYCDEAVEKEAQMRTRLQNIKDVLATKDSCIDELDAAIKSLESDMKAVCGGFLFSCRELRKEEFIAILDALETEKTKLIEYTSSLTERLAQERTENLKQAEQLSKQKTRISRLEAKCRVFKLEAQGQRIVENGTTVSKASTEKGGSSLVLQNTKMSIMASSIAATEDNLKLHMKMDDLKNQLEAANEKITLLEEKNKHLKEEKVRDCKVFLDVVADTKNLIMETVMGRQGKDSIATDSDIQSQEDSNCSSPVASLCTRAP